MLIMMNLVLLLGLKLPISNFDGIVYFSNNVSMYLCTDGGLVFNLMGLIQEIVPQELQLMMGIGILLLLHILKGKGLLVI